MDYLCYLIIISIGFVFGILLYYLKNEYLKYKIKYVTVKAQRCNLFLYAIINCIGWTAIYQQYSFNLKFIIYILIYSLCIIISDIDLKINLIPNELILILIFLASVLLIFSHDEESIILHIIGFSIGFLLFFIPFVFKNQAGAGDVKLASVIGLILGYPQIIYSLLLMCLFVMVELLRAFISKKGGLKTKTAYAPFICAGLMSVIIFKIY